MGKVEITHPDKVWFPKDKYTKEDVIAYYREIAVRMLPLIKGHPLVMQRYPDGIKKAGFFQKNVPEYFPKWVKTVVVKREAQGKGKLVQCDTKDTLLYLVNFGCLTPHVWLTSSGRLESPDRLIFDIDPSKGKVAEARVVVRALKKILERVFKLKPFLMTTGSRGYHVVVPIKQTVSFDEAREFAKEIAAQVTDEFPTICTTAARKASRRGRVYIDVMRNAYAQHAVAPFAVRALPGAPIAMPISWASLGRVEPQTFTIKNFRRASGANPWDGFARCARSISAYIPRNTP